MIPQIKPSSKHRWYQFPNLKSGKEGLVFCVFVSAWKHKLKQCFHCGIILDAREGSRPCESLECRAMAVCKSSPMPPISRLQVGNFHL